MYVYHLHVPFLPPVLQSPLMDHSASALNNSPFHPLKHLSVGVVALHTIRAHDQTLQPSALMMGRYKTDPRAGSAPLVLLQPDACLLHGSLCFCSGNQGGKPGHRVFRAKESTFSSSVFMSKEDSTASRRPVLVGNPAGPRRDPLKGYRRRGRAGPVEAIAAGDVESKVRWRYSKQISLVPQCHGCLSLLLISFQVLC